MTTITVQKIYPPKKEGWSHSIKATDGNYYGVKESVVRSISEGQTIEADVVVKEKDGKTYRDIVKLAGGDAIALASPTRSPALQSSAPRYGSTDDATAERIFTCGIVNAVAPHVYDKHGTLTSEHLTALVMVARVAWAETFGKK